MRSDCGAGVCREGWRGLLSALYIALLQSCWPVFSAVSRKGHVRVSSSNDPPAPSPTVCVLDYSPLSLVIHLVWGAWLIPSSSPLPNCHGEMRSTLLFLQVNLLQSIFLLWFSRGPPVALSPSYNQQFPEVPPTGAHLVPCPLEKRSCVTLEVSGGISCCKG